MCTYSMTVINTVTRKNTNYTNLHVGILTYSKPICEVKAESVIAINSIQSISHIKILIANAVWIMTCINWD